MYTEIYTHNMFHNTYTLYNSIPVSYTHLDVYKRQTLYNYYRMSNVLYINNLLHNGIV